MPGPNDSSDANFDPFRIPEFSDSKPGEICEVCGDVAANRINGKPVCKACGLKFALGSISEAVSTFTNELEGKEVKPKNMDVRNVVMRAMRLGKNND